MVRALIFLAILAGIAYAVFFVNMQRQGAKFVPQTPTSAEQQAEKAAGDTDTQ
jgi:hypothetical protein